MHFRQAMNHAVAIGAKHRVSALRRQESKKAKDGLPAAMFVNSDPIPGLVRRIEDKAKKRWSKRDFPETNLLIAASIPERSGAASTLIWDPKLDLKKLNANLSPTLGRCDYCAVYLYNMMQSRIYKWTRQTEWKAFGRRTGFGNLALGSTREHCRKAARACVRK